MFMVIANQLPGSHWCPRRKFSDFRTSRQTLLLFWQSLSMSGRFREGQLDRAGPFPEAGPAGNDRLSRSVRRSRESCLCSRWTGGSQRRVWTGLWPAFGRLRAGWALANQGSSQLHRGWIDKEKLFLFKVHEVLFDMHIPCEMIGLASEHMLGLT